MSEVEDRVRQYEREIQDGQRKLSIALRKPYRAIHIEPSAHYGASLMLVAADCIDGQDRELARLREGNGELGNARYQELVAVNHALGFTGAPYAWDAAIASVKTQFQRIGVLEAQRSQRVIEFLSNFTAFPMLVGAMQDAGRKIASPTALDDYAFANVLSAAAQCISEQTDEIEELKGNNEALNARLVKLDAIRVHTTKDAVYLVVENDSNVGVRSGRYQRVGDVEPKTAPAYPPGATPMPTREQIRDMFRNDPRIEPPPASHKREANAGDLRTLLLDLNRVGLARHNVIESTRERDVARGRVHQRRAWKGSIGNRRRRRGHDHPAMLLL